MEQDQQHKDKYESIVLTSVVWQDSLVCVTLLLEFEITKV